MGLRLYKEPPFVIIISFGNNKNKEVSFGSHWTDSKCPYYLVLVTGPADLLHGPITRNPRLKIEASNQVWQMECWGFCSLK